MDSKICNFCTSQDHRVRLQYWALTNMAGDGQKLSSLKLYGSKPPPNDALWANAKAIGMQVMVYEESLHRERENGRCPNYG